MIANVLTALIAVEHLYILVVEMFLWTRPYGLRAFGNTRENAEIMAVLAKNQGLYNGFLAAGLAFGLLRHDPAVKIFFVACVLVAGLYGFATTGKRSILFLQGGPAAAALAALLFL